MFRYLRSLAVLVFVAVVLLVVRTPSAVAEEEPSFSLVSVSSDGTPGNAWSMATTPQAISGCGRYVAFTSTADNLVPGKTNNNQDVFVHDHWTGETTLVSITPEGQAGNGSSSWPAISLDGRFVAFQSNATDLTPAQPAFGWNHIYVRDLVEGVTTRASVSSAGTPGNGDCAGVSLSADGRYVAFISGASNLVPGDTNGAWDVFVHDRETATTTRVSVNSQGQQAAVGAGGGHISANGRYVAFHSAAYNLAPNITNNRTDVFVHDRETQETWRVSVSSTGTQSNDDSFAMDITADGRYVLFASAASNLVDGDTNNERDIFLHDNTTGDTIRVNLSSEGAQANGRSWWAAISTDGYYVAFDSQATNLVSEQSTAGRDHIYLRSLVTGDTVRISQTADGAEGDAASRSPSLSADGRYIALTSHARNLAPGKTSTWNDVLLWDAGSEPISVTPLVLEEPHHAELALGETHYYTVTLESGTDSLLITTTPGQGAEGLQVMVRRGGWPMAGLYDGRTTSPGDGGSYELVLEPAALGEYHILVRGLEITEPTGAYEIVARVVPRHLSSFAPRSAGNGGMATLHITGTGLQHVIQMRLETGGTPVSHNTEIGIMSPKELWARFDLTGLTPGEYELVAVYADAQELRFTDPFVIVPGTGGRLEARIAAVESMRPNRRYTVWIEYENVGDADLTAPLMIVSTEPSLPLWMLGRETPYDGSVQFLATSAGEPANILSPGAKGRVPVFVRTDLTESELDISLQVLEASSEPVDWAAYTHALRPAGYTVQEWEEFWPALQPSLGDTWDDYLEALGRAANRLRPRGVDAADVQQLLAMVIQQAASSPVSAITGLVLDAETYAPLADVRVVARHVEGQAVRTESTMADGTFTVAFLPAGTYELYVEGYIVTPALTVTITDETDANGKRVFASPIPPEAELEPGLVQHSSPVTVDVEGTPHLVFAVNGAFYHTTYDGETWAGATAIPGAWGADPVLLYAHDLVDGTDPGLAMFWRAGTANEASLMLALALPNGAGGWEWSDPAVYSDHPDAGSVSPAAIIEDDGMVLAVWQMLDFDDPDADTDLYYRHEPLDAIALSWDAIMGLLVLDRSAEMEDGTLLPAGTPIALTADGEAIVLSPSAEGWSQEFEREFKFGRKGMVPRYVPYIGGQNIVEFSAKLEGSASEAGGHAGAGLTGKVSVMQDRVTGTVSGNMAVHWLLDRRACVFGLDQAILSTSLGLSGQFPIPQLTWEDPVFRIIKTEVGVQAGGTLTGQLIWKGQGGAWPDGEVSGLLNLGFYGQVRFPANVEAAVTGTGNLLATISASGFEVSDIYFLAEASAQRGVIKFETEWRYPPAAAPSSVAYGATLEEGFVTGLQAGMQVTTTMTLATKPGTTTVYSAYSVRADVATDVTDDGPPALALGSDGLVYAFWHRESEDIEQTLGNTVTHATYDGDTWTAPQALADTVGFGRELTVAQDGLGNLVIAWIHADAKDWRMTSEPEAVLAAYLEADVYFGVLQSDGTWTTPAPVSLTSGDYSQLSLRSLPGGQLWATWVEQEPLSQTLYAAGWDGSGWSMPAAVTTARIQGEVATFGSSGMPSLVWAQNSDAPELAYSQAAELFTATYDGSTWSEPVALDLEIMLPDSPKSLDVSMAGQGGTSLFDLPISVPPELCTKVDPEKENPSAFEDHEEPGEPPTPPSSVMQFMGIHAIQVVRPLDPNDKLGPIGYEESGWIDGDELLLYTVRFENVVTATAPAQEVIIYDLLDPSLAWETLVVREVAFGDYVHPIRYGEGGAYLLVDIPDHRPEVTQTWQVEVVVDLDHATGELTASFKTLDPATGNYPEDALAGFLPPNDDTGRGEGRISFSILPESGLADGVQIENQAEIVFDTEASIWTNVWRNTIGTPYALTVQTIGQGAVLRDPWKDLYFPGQVVTMTAIADPGWAFAGWSGDLSGTANPITVTIIADTSVTATFEAEGYTLETTVVGGGTIEADPDKPSYALGETVTLTAIADPGWAFAGWSGDATGTPNPMLIVIKGDTSIAATFRRLFYLPLVVQSPN